MAIEAGTLIELPKDEVGEEFIQYEVLFTFKEENSQNHYMVLAPVSDDEDKEVEITAIRYEENEADEKLEIFPIDSDEEWEMVEEVLAQYIEELQEQEE